MKRCSLVRLLAVCVVAVLSAVSAQAAEFPVAGDAHVNARLQVNFGTLTNLYVGNNNTALLKFDLSSLPSGVTSSKIENAKLVLFVNRVNTAGTVKVLPVSGGWEENTVTSVPSLGAGDITFQVSQAGQYVVIDVTSLVQGWIGNPGSNHGIALSSDNAYALFDSKENDQTAHAAKLDVTITSMGAQGPVGPQGIQGLTGATGAIGPVGPAGAVGPIGPVGPQGPPISFKGPWSSLTAYSTGDTVFYNGTSYIASTSNHDANPDTNADKWSILALKGATGAMGPQGNPGPQGDLGPTGVGVQGPQGPVGPTGLTSAAVWDIGTQYHAGALVRLRGSLFVALQDIVLQAGNGVEPGTKAAAGYWGAVSLGTGASPAGIPYTLVTQSLPTGGSDPIYLSLTGIPSYGDPISSSVVIPTTCNANLTVYYFGDVAVDFQLVRINFSLVDPHGDGTKNVVPAPDAAGLPTCHVEAWSGAGSPPATCTAESVQLTQGTVISLSTPLKPSQRVAYTAFSCH